MPAWQAGWRGPGATRRNVQPTPGGVAPRAGRERRGRGGGNRRPARAAEDGGSGAALAELPSPRSSRADQRRRCRLHFARDAGRSPGPRGGLSRWSPLRASAAARCDAAGPGVSACPEARRNVPADGRAGGRRQRCVRRLGMRARRYHSPGWSLHRAFPHRGDAREPDRHVAAKGRGHVGPPPGPGGASRRHLHGLFGGFGVGAYAAANAFLDGFMQYQRAAGSISSYTIAWSLWDEVGMSRGYTKKDLARSRGYRVLAPRTALQALDIALAHPPGHVVVGLDDGNRHIRRHLDTPRPEAQALRAYFTTRSADVTVEWSPKETLPDAFGTPTRCPGVPVTRLPLTADGDLDQRALREMEQRCVPAAAPSGQPRTDLEKLFASIWREVLGVDAVGIDDNFFDLGGDSVRIAQLGRRLGEVLGRDVALTDLFEYPTISAAVSHLAGSHDRERSVDTDVSGSRGQARRERTRRRPGPPRRADDRLDEDSHLPHE